MLSSTQNLPPKPALPPAAPPAPANTAGAPGGASFAQFLTVQAAPAPVERDAAPRDTDAAQATARRQAQPARPPQRPAEAKAEARPATEKAENRSEGTAVEAPADDEDTAETPQLKEFTQWLGLAAPQADAAKPALRARGNAAGAEEAVGRAERRARGGEAGRSAEVAEAGAARAADARASDKTGARTAGAEPLQATATAARSEAAPATVNATPPVAAPSFAAVLAQQAVPTVAVAAEAPAAPAQATLQSPLHGPAFAPELGARVSLMAIDGIQHAELQLNPADMGPVAVQIVVDGSQAQVSFHAAQAETRQALEQSLPELAAALQGQGLTLAGGGVFQQAPRDADHEAKGESSDTAGTGVRGLAGSAGEGAASAAAPQRRSVGLLDTFA
jgi:flagellar hook-length control protein FliK